MKHKMLAIVLLGIPVWSFMIYSGMSSGTTMGEAKILQVHSCHKGSCVASVELQGKKYNANIYTSLMNASYCKLEKHEGATALVQGNFACR